MRGLSVLKGRRRGAGALWLLCLGLPLSAPAIPLDQAVRAGLAIHPQVRSAMAEADRAGTEVEIAKGGYYPSVTMSGGRRSSTLARLSTTSPYRRCCMTGDG